jgi:hypothetical protein
MAYIVEQNQLTATKSFLKEIIEKHTSTSGVKWLNQKLNLISENHAEREIYLAFSMAPRFTGKSIINLNKEELQLAHKLCPGFSPLGWTVDQMTRTLIILSIPSDNTDNYKEILNKLFITADVDELITLYASLPLLPHPELHKDRGAEGIRTNMTIVFDAVALNNPYPALHFSEGAWNQMILKALFTSRPLYQIYGLDQRRNKKLAEMAIDYAHERKSANRIISPELWRLVAPFMNDELLPEIIWLLDQPDQHYKQAAALLCIKYQTPQIKVLLSMHPNIQKEIENGTLTWNQLAIEWRKSQNLF